MIGVAASTCKRELGPVTASVHSYRRPPCSLRPLATPRRLCER